MAVIDNADRAFQAAWIVYINGIEVPVVSASISYGVWKMPEAQIVMVPDENLHRFGAEDRVTVQVFYCDYWQTPSQPQFRLMFDGEIVGWGYVNVQRSRALTFTCVDYSQIFTQLFFFFMSSIDDLATGESGNTIGVTATQIQVTGLGPLYPYSLFAHGLLDARGEAKVITKPIQFVYNVVKGLIASDAPNQTILASNFFAPWAARTGFHKRFVSLPYLEGDDSQTGIFPIIKAVQADFAVSAVARLASGIGSAGSVWQLLQEVFQTLMVEMVMLPTPAAVQCAFAGLKMEGPALRPLEGKHSVFLTNYFVKPQCLFGIPPACNVFFPSQIEHFAYDETFITQPTRMYFNDTGMTSFLDVFNNDTPGMGALIKDALAVAHPEEANLALRAVMPSGTGDGGHSSTQDTGKNILIYPEEFFKGPVVDRRDMPRWFMFLANSQAKDPPPAPAAPTGVVAGVAAFVRGLTGTSTEEPAPTYDVPPGDVERNIYRQYAKYEYFKERYSRRTGTLNIAFNPYPVPGFPCAIFDNRAAPVDVIAYVMDVRQNLGVGGWSTQVSVAYGRTFQEMFGLLAKQFRMENAAISQELAGSQDNRVLASVERVGAAVIAPTEPIREVRDVFQSFNRAEEFYRALFYRQAPPETDRLSAEQASAALVQQAESEFVGPTQETEVVGPTLSQFTFASAAINRQQVEYDLAQGKSAACHYHQLIQLTDGERTEEISVQGMDATARLRVLEIIDKVRNTPSEVTPAELEFIQMSAGGIFGGDVRNSDLQQIELRVRRMEVTSNLDGNKQICVHPDAAALFNSYEAAMRYNSRPVCTLNEYLMFLGRDAAPIGLIKPEGSLPIAWVNRAFPANYYSQIRAYTPGPPLDIPEGDITNTRSVSMPDGINSTLKTEGKVVEGRPIVQSLPSGFPDTREDWSSKLLAYRMNVLDKLPPRS